MVLAMGYSATSALKSSRKYRIPTAADALNHLRVTSASEISPSAKVCWLSIIRNHIILFSTGVNSFLVTPLNLSNSSCTLSDLPEMDLPSDYRTYGSLPGGSFPPADNELETFDAYDLKVRQPIPILFSVQSGDVGDAKMVCIAPNNVLDGSRIPESEFPPSGAVSLQTGGAGTGVLVVGCVWAVLLINGVF